MCGRVAAPKYSGVDFHRISDSANLLSQGQRFAGRVRVAFRRRCVKEVRVKVDIVLDVLDNQAVVGTVWPLHVVVDKDGQVRLGVDPNFPRAGHRIGADLLHVDLETTGFPPVDLLRAQFAVGLTRKLSEFFECFTTCGTKAFIERLSAQVGLVFVTDNDAGDARGTDSCEYWTCSLPRFRESCDFVSDRAGQASR